ncbi:MAG TPA: ATPase, partial [Oribacterium sp.]|nr:ATPase [Oribacterium sp.]
MNHLVLKTVINDMHEVIKNVDIVDREYVFEKNVNYVLVGLRRAGKSTLLYKIAMDLIAEGVDWNRIIYVNFED